MHTSLRQCDSVRLRSQGWWRPRSYRLSRMLPPEESTVSAKVTFRPSYLLNWAPQQPSLELPGHLFDLQVGLLHLVSGRRRFDFRLVEQILPVVSACGPCPARLTRDATGRRTAAPVVAAPTDQGLPTNLPTTVRLKVISSPFSMKESVSLQVTASSGTGFFLATVSLKRTLPSSSVSSNITE